MEEQIAAHRKYLASLDVQRKALESEAEAIVEELQSPGENGADPMGIDTPLVDREGYPRGDVDVYRARTLRGRLAVIKNDHKDLMNKIQQGLVKLNAFQKTNNDEEKERQARLKPKPKPKFDPKTGKWVVMNWNGTVAGVKGGDKRSFRDLQKETINDKVDAVSDAVRKQKVSSPDDTVHKIPFARINSVAPESPASDAGLKEGDLICRFGSVHAENHQNLKEIGTLVPMAAGNHERIVVAVIRGDNPNPLTLQLRPRPWQGRGLLGCHIVPHNI